MPVSVATTRSRHRATYLGGMKSQSKHPLPMPSHHTVGAGVDADRPVTGPDSIPQAHFGKRPARWTDDDALLQSLALALAQAEQRLCDLVRDDPAPPAGLVGLFVKDVTRLRREEQLLRDQLGANRRFGSCLRNALAQRRLKPLLRCFVRRLRR